MLVTYTDIDQLKRTEIESAQREHRLKLVTDNAGSAIFYVDRQLRIRFANQPFADAAGSPADELLGKSANDVLAADSWAELQTHLEKVFGGSKVSYERQERNAARQPALDAHESVPGSQRGPRRGRVRGAHRHRGRRQGPRDDQVAGGAASPLRRQHPGTDRVSRQEPQVHVLQPGVRGLGAPLAPGHLRAHTARRDASGSVRVHPADPETRAERRARRVRARGDDRIRRTALDARPHRARLRREPRRARAVLHRVRHPRPQAHGAGPRGARGAAAAVHRQHSGACGVPRRQPALPLRERSVPAADRIAPRRSDRPGALRRARRRRVADAGVLRRAGDDGRARHLRARGDRFPGAPPHHARAHRARPAVRRRAQRPVHRRPRHHRPARGAGCTGRARIAAARDHGRRAGAGGVRHARRVLPLRQSQLHRVLRPRSGPDGGSAPARRRRPRDLPERAGQDQPRPRGRAHGVRPPRAGDQRRASLDDDPARARHRAERGGVRRLRADERHPRPEAGPGSVARLGSRASPHHGQRARARGLHRPGLSPALRESPQRGVAGREPRHAHRTPRPRRHGRGAHRRADAAAREGAAGRRSSPTSV